MAKRMGWLGGMLLLATVATACASGKVVDNKCQHGVGLDGAGALDYGVTNRVTVENVGEQGEITIFAKVSTNQGEYERKRTLRFAAGEQKEVDFLFTEPTIGAADIRCEQSVFP